MLNRVLLVVAIAAMLLRALLVLNFRVQTSTTCTFRYYWMFRSETSTASGRSPLLSSKEIMTLKYFSSGSFAR